MRQHRERVLYCAKGHFDAKLVVEAGLDVDFDDALLLRCRLCRYADVVPWFRQLRRA